MKRVFEIWTDDGVTYQEYPTDQPLIEIIPEVVSPVEGKEWYRIRFHLCRNEEQKPCDPWETVAQEGEVPNDE